MNLHIKSFVRRQSRMTDAQARLWKELWPLYCVHTPEDLQNITHLYTHARPITLEVGFGNGQTLFQMASEDKDHNYLGIEVYKPGIGRLLGELTKHPLSNLKLVCADIMECLPFIPDRALSRVHIFFPDPWPKTRHHKRRLVQERFIQLLESKLQIQGLLHLATDWPAYKDQMLQVLEASPAFVNQEGANQTAIKTNRPMTKYEHKARREGRCSWDLLFSLVQ